MGKLIGIARSTKPRQPMEEIDAVSISEAAGVDGDRRGKMEGRQVTILAIEDWQAACAEIEVDLPWISRRANLLVEGIDLPQIVGAEITIGDVRLVVCEETDPCSLMEKTSAGLRAALTPDWRGGVSCNVVLGGDVAIGYSVAVKAP